MNLTKTRFPSARNATVPALDVEVAFTSRPTEGPIWRTVVGDCRGFSSERGRPRELDRFAAGTCTVTLDNRDRDYDPEYTSSPLYPNVLPEKRMRILASYNSVQYVVFDGYVDGWPQRWQDVGKDATVQLSATDGFKILAQTILPSSIYELSMAALSPPPTHWWKLDEAVGQTTALDTAPLLDPSAAAHGTYSGGATLGGTALVPFDGGRTSITLDGSNDSIINPPVSSIPTSSVASVVMWFKHTSAPTDGAPDYLLHYGSTQAAGCVRVYLLDTAYGASSGKMRAQFGSGVTVTSAAVYDDNAAHFLAVTISATVLSLITDTATATAAITASVVPPGEFYIGAVNGLQSTTYWLGSVASVAVWDGITLTAAQLTELYNAGNGGLTGEASGTRVKRILDAAKWPGAGLSTSADRDLDTGSSTLGAYELAGGTALDYLQTLFDTEQGQMYMGIDGALSTDSVFKFVWRQRHATITATRSNTSQATFTDSGTLKYADLELSYDETKVFNESRVTRSGGAEQTAADKASQDNYFRRTYEKSSLLYATDAESFDHATWAINRYSDPLTRVESITIKPQRDPANLWPQVLGREIGDRVTVTRSAISKAVIIEGISHDYDGEEWTTVFRCSPADLGPYWVLDDAVYSVLGTTTIPAF